MRPLPVSQILMYTGVVLAACGLLIEVRARRPGRVLLGVGMALLGVSLLFAAAELASLP
jgi:hypothetical protein